MVEDDAISSVTVLGGSGMGNVRAGTIWLSTTAGRLMPATATSRTRSHTVPAGTLRTADLPMRSTPVIGPAARWVNSSALRLRSRPSGISEVACRCSASRSPRLNWTSAPLESRSTTTSGDWRARWTG